MQPCAHLSVRHRFLKLNVNFGAQADIDHTTAATWSCFECSPSEPIPSGLLQWLHVAFAPTTSLLLVDTNESDLGKVTSFIASELSLYRQRGMIFGPLRDLWMPEQVPVPAGKSTRELVANAVYNLQSLQLQSWRLPPSVRLLHA